MDLRAVDVDEWDENDDYKDHVCDIAWILLQSIVDIMEFLGKWNEYCGNTLASRIGMADLKIKE